MADLTKFIYAGLRPGVKFDLYFGRAIHIGDGEMHEFTQLRVKLSGKGEIFFQPFDASIEVDMPDLAPRGICNFKFGTDDPEKVEYRTEGDRLLINKREITIYKDGKWTWVWVKTDKGSGWAGLWPKGEAMTEEDKRMAPGEPVPF